MKPLSGAPVPLLLALLAACGGGPQAEFYGIPVQDTRDPGVAVVRDEVESLPFRHVEWEFKFRDEIARMSLGSEHLYLETTDHKVVSVDRFSGVKKWEYGVDTDTPLEWAPVEASGVPEEIRALESDLRAMARRIEDVVKEKGPGKESQELQKQRDQKRQLLNQAQDGDNIYFISRGTLYCLVRTTGNLLWTRHLHREFSPSGQPYAIRSRIFVPASDLARVWALDVERKGLALGSYRVDVGKRDKAVTSRPVYEEPSLFFASHDGTLYNYDITSGAMTGKFVTDGELRADPVVHRFSIFGKDAKAREARLLFIGGYDNTFYAIDPTSNSLVWKYEASGPIKSAAVAKDMTVYVRTEGGALFALDIHPQHRDRTGKPEGPRRSGLLRWKLPLGERFLVKGREHVYVMGPHSEVYRMNEMTGEVIGRYPLRKLSHVLTNTLDDVLYVAHPSGYVYALRESRE